MKLMPYSGLPVHISRWAPDGTIFALTEGIWGGTEDRVVVGVVAESDVAHEARSIVRRGLKDELKWLGLPTMTGRDLLAELKKFNLERIEHRQWNSDPGLLDAFVKQLEHFGPAVGMMWMSRPGVDPQDIRFILNVLR